MKTPSEGVRDQENPSDSNPHTVPHGVIRVSGLNSKIPAEEAEISRHYSKMTDDDLNRHIRILLAEVLRRHESPEAAPSSSASAASAASAPSSSTPKLREPKPELLDEEYLAIHENSTGISYDPRTNSFHYDRLPIADEFMKSSVQENSARRVNELNNYHMKEEDSLQGSSENLNPNPEDVEIEPPHKKQKKTIELKSRLSETYWSRRGGDVHVDCECSLCHQKFTNIRALLDHRHQAHSQKEMLTCGICDKEFLKRTHIFLHLSQEYKLYQCQDCQNAFASRYHLDKHNCSGKSKEKKKIVVKQEVEEHENENANEEEQPVEQEQQQDLHCDQCGKHYFQIHWLEKHREKCTKKIKPLSSASPDDPDQKNEYTCNVCSRKYCSPFWYERHRRTCVYPSVPKSKLDPPERAICEYCRTLCTNQFWLDYHLRNCPAAPHADSSVLGAPKASVAPKASSPASPAPREIQDAQDHPPIALPASTARCLAAVAALIPAPALSPVRAPAALAPNDHDYDTEQLYIDDQEMPVLPRYPKMTKMEIEEEEDSEVFEEEEELVVEEEEEEEEDDEIGAPSTIINTRCSICGLAFKGVSPLLCHRRRVHGEAAMLTCGLCNKKCNSKSSIRRHVNQEYSIFKCGACGKNCLDRTSLLRHPCIAAPRPLPALPTLLAPEDPSSSASYSRPPFLTPILVRSPFTAPGLAPAPPQATFGRNSGAFSLIETRAEHMIPREHYQLLEAPKFEFALRGMPRGIRPAPQGFVPMQFLSEDVPKL